MKIQVESPTGSGPAWGESIMDWPDGRDAHVYVDKSGQVWLRELGPGVWKVGIVDLVPYHESRETKADVKRRVERLLSNRRELWATAQTAAKTYRDAQDALDGVTGKVAAEYRDAKERNLARAAEKLAWLIRRINQEPMTWPQLSQLTGISALELEALVQEHAN